MSEKVKELREQAQELISFGNSKEKAKGHGMLTVLDTLEEEENFKLKVTFKHINGDLNLSLQSNNVTIVEVLGMLEVAKHDFLKNHA